MHSSTAATLLRYMARQELISAKLTTFTVPRYPSPVAIHDVKEAFRAITDASGHRPKDLLFTENGVQLEIYTHEKLFDKLFRVVFVTEKLYPKNRTDNVDGPVAPLPTLFIGSEKTQVRQIPLVETRPWPFKFLLELGGMIVCRPADKRDFILELKQFMNNHPQYEMRVDAKEWPDGSVAVFTYWFNLLPKRERKSNVNVPTKGE